MFVLERFGLLETLQVDRNRFLTFLRSVESGYKENPYHNAAHAADVVSMVYYLLRACPDLMANMAPMELFAFIIAACIHDLDHPGTNNNFHVRVL